MARWLAQFSSLLKRHFVSLRDNSESTQQDGGKKRTAERSCVTNVIGLLLVCFVVIII